MAEHPIQGLMNVTMEKIHQMVDSNTIIGKPITTEDGKDHDGDIKDLDDAFKKEIEKAVDQDAQTSEYLSVTCFEDGWPSSVLKQNKSVIAGRGKLKQKLIEACRFAQREK